jgi:hypothetical protein
MTKYNSISTAKRYQMQELRRVFADHERLVKARVRSKHAPHVQFLKEKGVFLENLREFSSNKIAAASLASSLLINPISASVDTGNHSHQPIRAAVISQSIQTTQLSSAEDKSVLLVQQLHSVVPAGSQNLTPVQEASAVQAIKSNLNLSVTSALDGYQLNRSFGLIGAEQHLYRYPGDNILEQLHTPAEFAMFAGAGIAPHVGAYGYFAPNSSAMTKIAEERERWYVVAQTFLSPQFKSNPGATVQFFKYRKFVVINPDSGQAVVGDLADAGPAEYTGKSFGGSPEVMNAIGYGAGSRKGRVIFMMIDDPNNQVPLGPLGVSK